MNPHLARFLSLRCAGDVLNVVSPLGNKAGKEITESMAMIQRIKRVVLPEPMRYTLWDLCAGNALTSVLAVFMLPTRYAVAVDARERGRPWHKAKRFEYRVQDIGSLDAEEIGSHCVVAAVHACTTLAEQVIGIFNRSRARHLFLMPCCHGETEHRLPTAIEQHLPEYARWAYHLSRLVEAEEVDVIEDKACLSPKNYIVAAHRQESA